MFPNVRIRIVLRGKEKEGKLLVVGHLGEAVHQRTPDGTPTGGVASEAEDQLVGLTH